MGSFRFFLRHFIIFQTRIDDFEMCGGSPGQIFFRILAKKHFENFFWVIFGDFFEKKIEDFLATKNEISAQKNFFIAYKNFFWKGKMLLTKNIYIFQIIEFQIKNF